MFDLDVRNPSTSLFFFCSVAVAAYFEKKYEALSVRKGSEVRLRCKAFGEKTLAVNWSKDRQAISADSDAR